VLHQEVAAAIDAFWRDAGSRYKLSEGKSGPAASFRLRSSS
jgi:hypothetical protein